MIYNGFVHGISMQINIGLYDWERAKKQEVIMDIDYTIHSKNVALSDNISDTVNYQKMIDHLKQFAESSNFKLVETLAEKLAYEAKSNFNVKQITIKLAKTKAINYAQSCGVKIERTYE